MMLSAASATLASACGPVGGEGDARALRVATFGGNFERAFVEHVYPAFEQATGIKVQSSPRPAGVQFLLQLIAANKAGAPPMDVCISPPVEMLRARNAGLWRPFDAAKLPNLANLLAAYTLQTERGLEGVGGLGWYLVLVTNPRLVQPRPESWRELWGARRDAWGLSTGGNSALYEIAAATFFGGIDVLNEEAGISAVLAKIAELKPNAKLWWDSEGTMQTALENGEVKGGTYFADVARTMTESGTALDVIFPAEGPVIDFGCWAQPTASTKTEEAHAFIDFMLSPQAQTLVATKVHAPPLIKPELLALPPEVQAEIGSPVAPIPIAVAARTRHIDFMSAQFTRMLAS